MAPVRDSKQQLAKVFDHIVHGDPMEGMRALIELCDDDVVFREPSSLPYGGVYTGPGSIAGLYALVAEYLTLERFEIERIAGDGDDVVVRGHVPLRASPANAGPAHICEWYTFRSGKIVEMASFVTLPIPLH
jgi:ketosteroid isomerase-like protein